MPYRVVVVGGTKGIGKAIADGAAKIGCSVIRLARRDSDVSLDLGWRENRIADAIERAAEIRAGIDWLVLSAGMGAYVSPLEMTEQRILKMFRTNTIGPILVYRAALRHLICSRGRVLFISSTVGDRGARGLSLYGASKSAIHGFVRSEARGLASHGVAMNALAPGWVNTDMTDRIEPGLKEAIVKSIPMRRMAEPDEIASFALSILSAPHFLTGQILEMSGGA